MRITAIEPQKKDPDRKNLIVDGNFLLGISGDVLVRFGLRRGDEIDEKTLSAVKSAEDLFQAKQKALVYLSRRMHSEKELVRKLQKKGFPDETIGRLVGDFRAAGYINDTQFAVAYATACMQKRPIGRRSLVQRLRAKGIEKEIIETVLSATLEADREEDAALEAATKKLKTSRSQFDKLDPRKRRQKLALFLTQRGFEWDVIGRTLDRVFHKDT